MPHPYARPCSIIDRKQVSWALFSKLLTDVDEIWHDLLLHRIHTRVQFDPDRCMGSSRPNDKDFVFFVFVIPKIYHNSSYIQRISRCQWLSNRLCCCENFPEFPTWPGPEQKRLNLRYLAHSLEGK